MKGNSIIVSANPQGKTLEGKVLGSPKPGSILELVAGDAMDGNGNFTFQVFQSGSTGDKITQYVLLPDELQGMLATGQYSQNLDSNGEDLGNLAPIYVPIPGEDLNLLVESFSGTSGTSGTTTAVTVGEQLTPHSGDGVLIPQSGVQEKSWTALEALTDPVSGGLTWCRRN